MLGFCEPSNCRTPGAGLENEGSFGEATVDESVDELIEGLIEGLANELGDGLADAYGEVLVGEVLVSVLKVGWVGGANAAVGGRFGGMLLSELGNGVAMGSGVVTGSWGEIPVGGVALGTPKEGG